MPKRLVLAAVAALALAAGLATGLLTEPTSAQGLPAPGTFSGRLPQGGGFALSVWGGGPAGALAGGASQQGCTLQSAFVTFEGRFLGYVPGAPEFVNREFMGLYPGNISAGTPFIVVCRGPAPTPAPQPTAAPTTAPPLPPAPSGTIENQFGAAVHDAINRYRAENGLFALQPHASLVAAAEKYSFVIRDSNSFDHDLDGMPWDRARREGYPSINIGEVIAMVASSGSLQVQRDAESIVTQWRNSPPHRAILLSLGDTDYVHLGVGCSVGRAGGLNSLHCVAVTGRP